MPGSPPDLAPAPRRPGRISRSGDFDAVYRRGRSAANRHLVVYAFTREDRPPGAPARLGLSVSRKVGGAVERNRVKRCLRERFAELAPTLPPGLDVVVIARPGSAEYLAERGSEALGARLAELAERAVAPAETTA
ncbi:MAG TPA: ribonuclease P protein component [Miltoncostaeaceae bacterium]|nr:ribonuclease P protein component [Miltoncostaeaceae bacterium]